MRIHLQPSFSGVDEGDGGVRRVVEAQLRSLPRHRIDFVSDPGDADVIALHILAPNAYLRRFPDKPMVAHCHGLYWSEFQWESWSYGANEEVLKLVCTADVTTAPSEWVAQVLRRHTARDVRVIPHGVSMREFKPATEHRGYVLWNKTRLDPVCTPDPLNALARAMPSVPFVSTYGDDLPNLVRTGKLPYEEAKAILRTAAVYLVTVRETFGIGTLEALACGIPVVGYRFGGQAEFIRHGVDGWLVEPGDIDGLAEGVRWAFTNREAAGQAAMETASNYTWTRAAGQYAALYREVYERHREEEHGPRVSIVVPAYNLAAYLPETLESVRQQDDPNWECIVVDDASPDACGPIAEEFAQKDSRFKVIHNAKNEYLAEARNIAIREARGKYILPLDADDAITSYTVRLLADALDADKTLAIAYGGVMFTEEDGQTPTNYEVPGKTPGHSGWPVPFEPWRQVAGYNLLPYCSMYRKTLWQMTGGYRRRLVTAEDADFWTRATSYGWRAEMVMGSDTLVYRNRERSMSREQDAHRYDYLKWFPWAKDKSLAPAGLAGRYAVSLYEPHIAVVIPVGPGHEKLVQDAVDSVGAQSYGEWECIVVNDSGAPLHLPAWARVIETDVRDPAAARNLGIGAATAPLFLPLDADDFLQPDALQWLATAFVNAGGDGIIYPDFFEDYPDKGQWHGYRLDDWTCDGLTQRGAVHTVTALTPVTVWKAVGGYRERVGWEDWDFQMRAAKAGVCSHHLAVPLFNYRKHTGGRHNFDPPEYEQRKAQMLADWTPYFRGEARFMACGCNSRTLSPAANGNTSAARPINGAEDGATLVEYIGGRGGSVRYRGVSGAFYLFDRSENLKWVRNIDVPMFARHADFRIRPERPQDIAPAAETGEPFLVAAG